MAVHPSAGVVQARAAEAAVAAEKDVSRLWDDIVGQDGVALRERLLSVLPQLVNARREVAAGFAADWYTSTRPAGASPFEPIMAQDVTEESFRRGIFDALEPVFSSTPNYDSARGRIEGLVVDYVMGGFRDTISMSSEQDEAVDHWVRVVESGACSWCRKIAGDIYYTAGDFKRHTHCKCSNAPVWSDDYDDETEIQLYWP